jgi:hypothetical protein
MSRRNGMPSLPSANRSPKLRASCLQGDGVKIEPRSARVDRGQTNRRTFMSSPVVWNDVRIDHACSTAICEEIGDRLRINLGRAPDRLPEHMMLLVQQMAQNDCVSTVLGDTSETALNQPSFGHELVTLRPNQNPEVAK